MRFFIDNNLSPQLAKGMSGFGEDVVHLQDHFPADTPDEEWLKFVGQERLILLSRDESIRRHPLELAAFRQYRVKAFFIGGKKLDRCAIVRLVVRHWHRMKDLAGRTRPPFAFRIPRSGTNIVRIPLQ